jgi:hypothetical protein
MNISRTPRPIVGLFLFIVAVFISQLTACGGSSPQVPPVPVLKYIVVFPATAATSTIDIGQTEQFTAGGTYSDGSTKDLSNQVTWSSSNQAVATINSRGLALGLSRDKKEIPVNTCRIRFGGMLHRSGPAWRCVQRRFYHRLQGIVPPIFSGD